MKKKLKGGIETIIATIILAGIVIALILVAVLPMTNEIEGTAETGRTAISSLKSAISGK